MCIRDRTRYIFARQREKGLDGGLAHVAVHNQDAFFLLRQNNGQIGNNGGFAFVRYGAGNQEFLIPTRGGEVFHLYAQGFIRFHIGKIGGRGNQHRAVSLPAVAPLALLIRDGSKELGGNTGVNIRLALYGTGKEHGQPDHKRPKTQAQQHPQQRVQKLVVRGVAQSGIFRPVDDIDPVSYTHLSAKPHDTRAFARLFVHAGGRFPRPFAGAIAVSYTHLPAH